MRRQERLHEAVERRLCTLGAPVPGQGQDSARRLLDALEGIGAVTLRRRELPLRLGHRRRFRRAAIAVGTQPYPKQLDDELTPLPSPKRGG